MDLSFSCRPVTLFDVNATRKVSVLFAGAAPWRTKPVGAAVRCSSRTMEPADVTIPSERTARSLGKVMAITCTESKRGGFLNH